MRTGRCAAFVGVIMALLLAGVGFASAVPASGPSTPRSAPSYSAARPTSESGPSSPAPPAPAVPTTPSDPATTAPSPTAIATEPTTITPSATGTVHGLTAVFNNFCSDFGFDVTNNTAVAHTVHIPKIVLDLGNTLVGPPVVVPPGATRHVPLPFTTQAGTEVQLVDETGAVILTEPIRFCVSVENLSATIRANTSYTLNNYLSITLGPPLPRNGGVVSDTGPYPNTFLRYTPDPCFAGTDHFGYDDFVGAVQGVVTVTVQPGPCRISAHRSTTNCAANAVSYTATNPYVRPAHLILSNSTTPGADRDLLLPAHRTVVIATVTFAHPTTGAQLSFTVRNTTRTVLTDHVTCPSLMPADQSQSRLAATGAAPTRLAALGAAAVALGGLIILLARWRKPERDANTDLRDLGRARRSMPKHLKPRDRGGG